MKTYEEREAEIFANDLARAERGTVSEKAKASKAWSDALANDPELIAERVDWLLAGHYGKGAYDAAWKRVRSEYVAPTSWLLETIAALEWMVGKRDHYHVYIKIPYIKQAAVFDAIAAVVLRATKSNE